VSTAIGIGILGMAAPAILLDGASFFGNSSGSMSWRPYGFALDLSEFTRFAVPNTPEIPGFSRTTLDLHADLRLRYSAAGQSTDAFPSGRSGQDVSIVPRQQATRHRHAYD
jgi:hypothetical protein